MIEQFTRHRVFWLLALASIAAIGLAVRLHGLTLTGIGGNDTILYYSLAEQWLEGNCVFSIGDSTQVFRPVLLAFNALALVLLGHTDYAIKLANTLLDTVNILLVAALAHVFFRRRAATLACAFTYALLPIAIWSSRQELAHTCSTFLALCAYLCVWLSNECKGRRGGDVAIFLTGGFVAAATLTHEDLIFLSIPLGLVVILANRESDGRSAWLPSIRRAAFFASLPLIAAGSILARERERIGSVVSGPLKSDPDGGRNYFEVFGRFLWDVILGSSSAIFVGLVLAAVAYAAHLQWKNRARQSDHTLRWLGFCLLTPIVFVALYALFFKTIFPRSFLLLMPLLLIAVIHAFDRAIDQMSEVRRGAALLTLVAIILLSSLASYSAFNVGNRRFSKTWAAATWPTVANFKKGFGEFAFDARYRPNYATHWRMLYEALKDRVDSRHRLLITPSTAFYSAGRRALQTDAYFGDDAVYLLDHVQESLAQVIAEKSIKTVVFTTGQNRPPPNVHARYLYDGQWADPEPIDLAASFGFPHYSVEQEFHAIARFLEAIGGTEILPFPSGSYEARHTRVWVLP
ncbi:MAG: glycosyltransferase family 39 protein [Deltaproteobacteria bacterium]|jgi:4-amino-4-deoxy-L-arabinose transferase-like glycosyltransferase|nr:glycosyltransferase family 39 protein [Deltaproteobacteria bacterium]